MSLAVEIAVADPGQCPVARTADRVNASTTEVSRASSTGDGPVTEEFTLSADGPAEPDSETEVVATTEVGQVYRFERDGANSCVCERIEAYAGPATDVRAEGGTLVVETRVDDLDTVRTVVEQLRNDFGGVIIRRLTELAEGASAGTDRTVVDRGRLTTRQREVLETAHEMGYYDYPKAANAGEVADELGITRSTFAEHLAAAQGKLLASILDPDGDATA